jgi:hypothetical protein
MSISRKLIEAESSWRAFQAIQRRHSWLGDWINTKFGKFTPYGTASYYVRTFRCSPGTGLQGEFWLSPMIDIRIVASVDEQDLKGIRLGCHLFTVAGYEPYQHVGEIELAGLAKISEREIRASIIGPLDELIGQVENKARQEVDGSIDFQQKHLASAIQDLFRQAKVYLSDWQINRSLGLTER